MQPELVLAAPFRHFFWGFGRQLEKQYPGWKPQRVGLCQQREINNLKVRVIQVMG